jgi:hypothetical protein
MIQKISAPVSVSLVFDHRTRSVMPKEVIWDGRNYSILKVGLHHTYRAGRNLFHVFSVASENLFFRLVLDTETLHWRLEEISDGLPF